MHTDGNLPCLALVSTVDRFKIFEINIFNMCLDCTQIYKKQTFCLEEVNINLDRAHMA